MSGRVRERERECVCMRVCVCCAKEIGKSAGSPESGR